MSAGLVKVPLRDPETQLRENALLNMSLQHHLMKNILPESIYQNNPSPVRQPVNPRTVCVTDRWANVILLLPQPW